MRKGLKAPEILETENLCIQDEPVYCSAVCPVHVDVRSMMEYLQKGLFEKAHQIYRSRVLFSGIISRLCEQPCREKCLRKEIDDAVEIRLLEKACTDHGGTGLRKFSASRKKEKIIIVGGGLTGLSCAVELTRKGYKPTLYEKGPFLGGRLLDTASDLLPEEIRAEELALAESSGAEIVVNHPVESLSDLECDALFIATGRDGSLFDCEHRNGIPVYDPVSLQSSSNHIFIGGDLLKERDHYSVIHSVADGVRAARSIERVLKKVSLTSGRENEGIQSTRLYTDTSRKKREPVVRPDDGFYTADEAGREARRCLLCECMECAWACTFLDHFNNTPRQYIRDITKTLTAKKGLRSKMVASRLINSCSLCGQCGEICPTNLDMGEVCHEARYLQVEAESMPPAFHEFWLREMADSTREETVLFRHQPGNDSSRYLFFPGCRMGSSLPDYTVEAYRYLIDHCDEEVGLALSCCGAPADWSGREDVLREHKEKLYSRWEGMGKPKIITACPTCQKMFTQNMPELPVVSFWTMMDRFGLPDGFRRGEEGNIALYDPCSSRYIPEVQQAVRNILGRAGYQIEELQYSHRYAQCCTYGGLIDTVNPELAEKIRKIRTEASSLPYVTYCTNCRDDFAGHDKPVWYLLDILSGRERLEQARRRPPTKSERRENRLKVKENVLETFWGERVIQEKREFSSVRLSVSRELEEKLDSEYILLDDIRQVIYRAEKTGAKLFMQESGHTVAHLQIGIITYWAEYQKKGDTYTVYNGYCHRMQIVEEG